MDFEVTAGVTSPRGKRDGHMRPDACVFSEHGSQPRGQGKHSWRKPALRCHGLEQQPCLITRSSVLNPGQVPGKPGIGGRVPGKAQDAEEFLQKAAGKLGEDSSLDCRIGRKSKGGCRKESRGASSARASCSVTRNERDVKHVKA
jgi:hypothetical protein